MKKYEVIYEFRSSDPYKWSSPTTEVEIHTFDETKDIEEQFYKLYYRNATLLSWRELPEPKNGYHARNIEKGTLGNFSKIREEYQEFEDAYNQGSPVLELVELSDLIGAIESYTLNHYDIELSDLIKMTRATERAFKDGTRK